MKWLLIAPAASLFLLASCTTPPPAVDQQGNVTIRQTDADLQSQGFQLFQEYKKKKPISRNAAYNSQLRRVANRIKRVVSLPGAKWEFVVFEDKSPNAFALPGGKVGVNTGLFPITRDDAGLATVVAHEIAHVTSNHAHHRIQQQQSLAIGGALLDAVLGSQGIEGGTRETAGQLYGAGAQVGFGLPFSRNQELEADQIGLIFMAKAGYDPSDAVGLWKRFAAYHKKHGGQQPEFLRTHPLDDTRIQKLEAYLPVAQKYYRP
jgi:predicted Zn-dependent protease